MTHAERVKSENHEGLYPSFIPYIPANRENNRRDLIEAGRGHLVSR